MKTLEIGQQGKLGNEVLSVVSINGGTFKCDNGKMYMISNAQWMTNSVENVEVKTKHNPIRELTFEEKGRLAYLELTGNDVFSALKSSTRNYRAGKSGFSSLTK